MDVRLKANPNLSSIADDLLKYFTQENQTEIQKKLLATKTKFITPARYLLVFSSKPKSISPAINELIENTPFHLEQFLHELKNNKDEFLNFFMIELTKSLHPQLPELTMNDSVALRNLYFIYKDALEEIRKTNEAHLKKMQEEISHNLITQKQKLEQELKNMQTQLFQIENQVADHEQLNAFYIHNQELTRSEVHLIENSRALKKITEAKQIDLEKIQGDQGGRVADLKNKLVQQISSTEFSEKIKSERADELKKLPRKDHKNVTVLAKFFQKKQESEKPALNLANQPTNKVWKLLDPELAKEFARHFNAEVPEVLEKRSARKQ